jgi:hypothetical protein
MTNRELVALQDLLPLAAAAAELGVTTRRVNQMIERGQLPATKLANVWVVRRNDLERVRHRPMGRPPGKGKSKTPKKK